MPIDPRRVLPMAILAFMMGALSACGGTGQAPPVKVAGEPAAGPVPTTEGAIEEHLSKAVAIVNGVTIYHATYEEILEELRGQIAKGDPDSVERFLGAKEGALDKVIEEELLFQEAIRRGYEPSKQEVQDVYVQQVVKAGSEPRMLASARSRRFSKSELIYALRRRLALDQFVQKEFDATLSPGENEVRAFYETRPELFTPDPWVKLSHIWVAAPGDWSAEKRNAALSRITQALERLRKGEMFEDLAREYGQDESAALGGTLGLFKRGNLFDRLDRVAFDLEPGEFSDVVQGENGYHILKSLERLGGKLEPFEKVKDDARRRLMAKKRGDALSALISRLSETAEIARMLE